MELGRFPVFVLKLNVDMRDDACRRKVLKVLSSICDTSKLSVNWKTGFAHIGGFVDINLVWNTLAKSGYKAELVDVLDWTSKSEYKSEVVDNWTTKSELEVKVADNLSNAGYQTEEVDRTTRLFGRHRIDERKPHDPHRRFGRPQEFVLKLNVDMRDDACRRKVLKVLSSICETYYVSIDWKTGFIKIAESVVDMNLVLHTLAKSGYKAEVINTLTKAGYKAEVVDTLTKSDYKAEVVDNLAKAGYKMEVVDRPTPMYGHDHRIDERKPHDPHPRHISYASSFDSRYGYELAGGHHNSRTGCTHHHHCHGRNGCALPLEHGINHYHRPLPPCHYDSQIRCIHHHHCHGRYGCALHHQHGIKHCHQDNRTGCNYHHDHHGTDGCVHHHQHYINHCHRPLPPCHHAIRIGCTHHHYCHGKNGCALHHQHGINRCVHKTRAGYQ